MGRLFQFSVERTHRSDKAPQRAITAPDPALDHLQAPDKGLSENRDRYFAQSLASLAGGVAPLPHSAPPAATLRYPSGLAEARRVLTTRARRLGASTDVLRLAHQQALQHLVEGRSVAASVALAMGVITGRRNTLLRER